MNKTIPLLPSVGLLFVMVHAMPLAAQESETLRVGIIGLDTSHVPNFTKSINAEPADPAMYNCRVVAAYPYGSKDIESSASRIPKYTAEVKALGLEVVDSIDDLLSKVDVCCLKRTRIQLPEG